jgi:hypothetical protein
MIEISSMMSRDARRWNRVLAVEVREKRRDDERRERLKRI